ncbi:MAG TPA: 30S ribosomal protein S16 [Trueperaceae bacterium]|jgi:small subunit ribosomal protein S16
MVKIRLMRMGSIHNPHFRLVVVDSRTKRAGDYIEQIGYYDPRETTEESLKVNAERASHWLKLGAQPTDTALRLLEKAGVETPNVKAKRKAAYRKRQEAAASS